MKILNILLYTAILSTILAGKANGQNVLSRFSNMSEQTGSTSSGSMKTSRAARDTTNEIPRGLFTWTVNPVGGDRTDVIPDTTWYMRMNHVFAEGIYGEYNTTGNNGSPRQSRIFMDRKTYGNFIFTDPYSQFIVHPEDFHFTNTYSPITNLTYHSCGDKTDGEDWFKALFAVNINKQIGWGFKFDYLYARGYYQNQSTSHFNFSTWGSYIGDRYQAHLLFSTNHQKVKENGGLQDDELIVHPQKYDQNYATTEMPVFLSNTFNRNDNFHIFLNHRYNIGFSRKVPMTEEEIKAKKFAMEAEKDKAARNEQNNKDNDDENNEPARRHSKSKKDNKVAPTGRPSGAVIAGDEPASNKQNADTTRISMTDMAARDSIAAEEAKKKAQEEADMFMKTEYVPVTSFFHNLNLNRYGRNFISQNKDDKGYYANDFYSLPSDSIDDYTQHLSIHNTVGIALLEGFNKYVKAGLKAFARHEFEHFKLPQTDDSVNIRTQSYNENNLYVGGVLSKREGKLFHFNALGEVCIVGNNIGNLNILGNLDFNFKLFGDTLHLNADASYRLQTPTFYYRHYASRHFKWDNDLSNISHLHIGGSISWDKTNTKLSIGVDNISNYTYFAVSDTLKTANQTTTQTGTDLYVRQASNSIQVLTAQLQQNFTFNILHWDNVITFQHSSDELRLPLPKLNIYSALYLRLKIAKVLDCDLGGDVRYFTNYYAPEYSAPISQFAIQENESIRTKIGNYPFVDVFANLQLKNCRFYVMMSHINCSAGRYFLTPHYPTNQRVFRIGISWNFFN